MRSNLDGERAAFGAQGDEPDPGDDLLAWWASAGVDDPVLADRVMTAVIRSRASRLTAERTQRAAAGPAALHPAIVKLLSSEAKQHTLEVALDARDVSGTGYAQGGYALEQPVRVGIMQGDAAAR